VPRDSARLRAPHFLFNLLICWTSISISSEVSLPTYFGILPLPLVMMLYMSSVEVALVEVALSEMSDGPPKWRPSAVLPWHFAQFFWKMGLAPRVVSDGWV
jgi:hypothetical protein